MALFSRLSAATKDLQLAKIASRARCEAIRQAIFQIINTFMHAKLCREKLS